MLALLTKATCIIASITSFVGAHPADSERPTVSFVPHDEYRLSRSFDHSNAQSFFDVHPTYESEVSAESSSSSGPTRTQYTLRARPTTVYRPTSNVLYEAARLRSLHRLESQPIDWEPVETLGPDVEDQHTLGQLARMTGNAYALPGQKNWYDMDKAWNTVRSIELSRVLRLSYSENIELSVWLGRRCRRLPWARLSVPR